MDVTELTEQQAMREMRAEYQRMETQLHQAKRLLAALLWVHGPMELPKGLKGVPDGVFVHERVAGGKVMLTATLTTPRRPS